MEVSSASAGQEVLESLCDEWTPGVLARLHAIQSEIRATGSGFPAIE